MTTNFGNKIELKQNKNKHTLRNQTASTKNIGFMTASNIYTDMK